MMRKLGDCILVDYKELMMAEILQLICEIWGFMIMYISKVWTYVGISQKQSNEVGDVLKWTMEEVIKLQAVLKVEKMLNKRQCINLGTKLQQVVLYAHEMITKESSNKCGVLLEELHRITRKIRVLVEDCGNQQWCHEAAFQMNNKEAFRELVDDLKCFWNAISERYLAIYPDANYHRFACINFDVATCDEIESDDKALAERLTKQLHEMPNDYEEFELAKHLWRRWDLELREVKGAEMNAWEVSIEPVILRQIGGGEVYKSRWLGLESATKTFPETSDLKVLTKFRKEAGILACLSHPNLVKFICCGRFNESLEENHDEGMKFSKRLYCFMMQLMEMNLSDLWKKFPMKVSRNPNFLVMEVMEMSLSDLLKKQRTPLRYFVAVDIMHEIARGMCYLHDMHVAHLDLKPSNVLVSSLPRVRGGERNVGYDFVKLVDFGTSRMEVQSTPELQEHTVGTTKYMAPEMNNKKEKNMACPIRADVWSFAMTCSEILSLKEPFPNTNSKDILQKINVGFRPLLPENCEDLRTLIGECWVRDPLQRPTFSSICKRLASLKKFMVGTYPNEKPRFGKVETRHLESDASPFKKVHERETDTQVVVGREHDLANVRERLEHANIVGLIGTGGIGKTTLAKAIYDDVGATYNASCFIQNLKGKSSLDILCEILEKFGKAKGKSWELVDAQNVLRELLATKKVLIILDDPSDAAQVNDIISRDVFCANKSTKILITTRDRDVIRDHMDVKEDMIEVGELDEIAAKTLFISCAFVNEGELLQPFDLCDKIIKACKGLPLSLTVMGKFLQGKVRIRSWERALQSMERGRCLDGDEGLWSTLQISFDELDSAGKNIFLDIACFFPMCMIKDIVLCGYDNYGSSPNHVLNILVERSLIKIGKSGYLQMHDHLRDMGRKIAEKMEEYSGT